MSTLWTPSGERPIRRTPDSEMPPDGGSGAPGDTSRGPLPEGAGRAGNTPEDPGARRARLRRAAEEGTLGLDEDQLTPEEREVLAAQIAEARQRLLSTPPEAIVANHCYGLCELAAMYLSSSPPILDGAQLAIDAFACLVDGLRGRLGPSEGDMKEALTQLQLAFVQIRADASGGDVATGDVAVPDPGED